VYRRGSETDSPPTRAIEIANGSRAAMRAAKLSVIFILKYVFMVVLCGKICLSRLETSENFYKMYLQNGT
jgi:hypothetical protein